MPLVTWELCCRQGGALRGCRSGGHGVHLMFPPTALSQGGTLGLQRPVAPWGSRDQCPLSRLCPPCAVLTGVRPG